MSPKKSLKRGPVSNEHPEALYYHIAGDALKEAQDLQAMTTRFDPEEFRLAQRVCTCMVFSAMTLEAYINKQFAELASTSRTKLANMSLEEKWRQLPLELGQPATFDDTRHPFSTFKGVIKLRNDVLVHFKPGQPLVHGSTTPKECLFADLVKDTSLAAGCFDCIAAMINELSVLTGRQTDVPGFLNGARYLSSIEVTCTLNIAIGAAVAGSP